MDHEQDSRVDYSVIRRIAVLAIDNPPVNAMSSRVRSDLATMLARAAADSNVDAIVLTCRGTTFVAGADIRELGKTVGEISTPDLFATVERSDKPVIAAIHGRALGGGLELALSCHWRVALDTARLGLPEINLGLIPGAGGTQRLPRLVGIEHAARMILSGKPIDALAAMKQGLLDALWEDRLLDRAVMFAEGAVSVSAGERRTCSRSLPRAGDGTARLLAEIAGASDAARRAPRASKACVEALTVAVEGDFDRGMKTERSLFLGLVAGEESKALRSLFFAERAVRQVRGLDSSTKAPAIDRIAVVGAGTMGRGIAIAGADAGYEVALIERDVSQRQAARAAIEAHYASLVTRGRATESRAKIALDRIEYGESLAAAVSADLVIEAVFEEMSIKRAIFAELDSVVRPEAILATNTSTLDVDQIASATGRPGSVVGMHFFSPANVMRLLEVVRGSTTSAQTLKAALVVGERLGKICVTVGVCDGFVGNRMSARRARQIELMLQEGALPEEIDEAARQFGFAMGPCAATDLAGLDISWRVRRSKGLTAPIADALCERNRLGQKAGCGYYAYAPGSRVPSPDPEVASLIRDASARLGITRRTLNPDEIIDRLLLPMVNEGARILEEGIAQRPSDIDLVWVNGFGWPARRGGPMFFADTIGLPRVCERLEQLAQRLADDSLRPADLLARLASQGGSFEGLQAIAGRGYPGRS